jgi:hypothetical protein
MPTSLDPAKLSTALVELGVTPGVLHAIRTAHPSNGKKLLDELKLGAKSRYRKLALQLHPDCNGGDPEKTAKFSFLSQVIKQIESMEYKPLPPAPAPPPMPQTSPAQHFQHVVFRAVPISRVTHRPVPGVGTASKIVGAPASAGPQGIHVVFLRPT